MKDGKMQYSPKLKNAIKEIKELLRKYDIAGTVVIHTPGHSEYLNFINPSYSCLKIDNATGHLRLNAKKEHFKDEKEREEKLSATSNMLKLMSDVSAKNCMMLIETSDKIDKFLNAEHGDEDHTSETTQNN